MKTIADKPHTVAIADIKVSNRHRREMGDIASLAGSMGELGLLQPVVVRDQSAPFQIPSMIQSVKFEGGKG